jgi:beta-N-acetylhexosaminidase
MSLGPLMVDIAGLALSAEDREVLAHPLVGSVILFTRNYADPAQLTELVASIHALRQPALLVAVDHEGGRVQRFRPGFTLLPALRHLGHQFDLDPATGLDLARRHGWLMASELLACGLDFSFAPCVDLDYGLSSVIGDRALHSRAAAVGELAVAYMHGMRDAGMAATAKHFPGHGAVVADSHLALPIDRRQLVDLEPDLTPYRLLIDNGLQAVMVAHVLFPAIDELPASLSRRWITGLLRGELRFQGTVFADDLSMAGAAQFGDIGARARHALHAGCDVLPVCNARADVHALLDGLKVAPDAAAHLRLARLRPRAHPERAALLASEHWRASRAALQRCVAPLPLQFDGGGRA